MSFASVSDAITSLKVAGSRKGVSRSAIKAKLGDSVTVARVNVALKKAVAAGKLIQIGDSFKVTAPVKRAPAPKKKATAKKPAARKPAAKKATKKKAAPKKKAAKKPAAKKAAPKKKATKKKTTKKKSAPKKK